uniref:Uncharacterized protein n=1 Tax=Moniliophthora roreri TaxID=221103 RepID=A0A0W0FUM7_MONRR
MKSFFQRKHDNTAQAKSASKLWNPRQPEPEIPHKSSGRTEKQVLGTGVKKSGDKQRTSSRAPRLEPPTEIHGSGTNYTTAYTTPPSKSTSSRPPLTIPSSSSSIPNATQRPPQHVDTTRTAKASFDMPTGSYNMPQASIRLVTDQNVVPPSPYVSTGRQVSPQTPAPAPTPGPTLWIPPPNAYSSSSRMYREGGADDSRERDRLNGMERREREKDRGRDRDRIRDRDREVEKAEGRDRERERDARARERLREDPQARVKERDAMEKERDRAKDRDQDRGRERDKEKTYRDRDRDRELERREKTDRERAKMRETLQRDRERPSTRDKENSRVREALPLDGRDYYPYRDVDRKRDAERPRGQSRHPEREKNRVPELPPSSDRIKVDEWGRTIMRDNKAARTAGKDSSDEGENSDAQKYGVSRRRDRTYDLQNQSASGAHVSNGAPVLTTPSVSQNAPQSSSRSRVTPQSANYAPPQQYASKAPSIAIPAPQSTSTKPTVSTSQVTGQATSLSQQTSNPSKLPTAPSSTSQTASYSASNGQHARVPSSSAQYPHSSAHNMAQAQAGARMTGATVTQTTQIASLPPSNVYSSSLRPTFTSTSASAQIPIIQSNSKASNNSVSYASQTLPPTYSTSTQHLSKMTSATAPVPPTPIHIPSMNLSSSANALYEPQNQVAQPPVAIPVKQLAELREPQSGNEGIGTSSGSDNELKGHGHRSRRKHREREDYDRAKYSSRSGNEYRPSRTSTTQPVITSSSVNPAPSSRDRARAADLPATHTSSTTTTDNVRADRRQASTSARYGATTADNPVPVASAVFSSTYVAPSAVRDHDERRDLEPVTSAPGDNTKADRRQATTSARYGTSNGANAVAIPPATSLSTYPVPSTSREYDERRDLEQVGGYPAISSSRKDYIAPIRPIDDSPPYASVSQHSPLRRTDGIDPSAAMWRPPSRPQSRAYGTHAQAPATVGNSPHPSLQARWTPPTAAKTSPALHSSDHSKGSPQQFVNSSPGRGTIAAADSPASGAVRRAGDHSPSTQAGQPSPSYTVPVAPILGSGTAYSQAPSNVAASTSKSYDYQATRDKSSTRVPELVAGYEMRTSPAVASRNALSRSERAVTESRPSGDVNGASERPPENHSPSFNVSLAANDRGRVISISASNDSGSPNVAVEPATWNSTHSPNRTHVASEARARKQSDSRPGKSDSRGFELPLTDPGPRRIHNAESYSKPPDYNGTGTALASATLPTAPNGKNAEADYRPATQHYQAGTSNYIYPSTASASAAASNSVSSTRARKDEPTVNSSAYRRADAPVPAGSKIADATRNQSSSQPAVEPSGNVMSFRHPVLAELLSDNVLRSPRVTAQQQTTVPVTQSYSNQANPTQPPLGVTSWPDPSPTPVPVSSRIEPTQSTTTRSRTTSTNMPPTHNTPAIYQSNGYNEQVPVSTNADTSRLSESTSARYPNATYADAGGTALQPAAVPPSPQTPRVVNSTHMQNHANHPSASIIPVSHPNPSPTSINNAAILHNPGYTSSQQKVGNRGYEAPATEKPYDVLPFTTNAVSSSISQSHPLATDPPSHIPPAFSTTRRPVYHSLHNTAPAPTNASPSVPSQYISQNQNPNQYGTSSHMSSGAQPPSPEHRPRRRPSEESLLKTPSSLATSLKPTVSRTSVPASVHSTQESRKKGFLSRLMLKQPQDAHQIWHSQEEPTLQVPIKHEVSSKVETERKPPSARAKVLPPINVPIPVSTVASHKSPNKKVFTPFRYLSSKRNRTMSAASMEAVDGTAQNTVGSPTASMHSSQPPFQPPSMRDPYLATQEWQGEFNSLRGEKKYRTYKPGVVFDVAHEPAHDRQNLKYSQSRSRRKSNK